MKGDLLRIAGPLSSKMTGTTLNANPIKPSKLDAHWNPRFVYRACEANGKKAPKVFRPSEASDNAEAAYFS